MLAAQDVHAFWSHWLGVANNWPAKLCQAVSTPPIRVPRSICDATRWLLLVPGRTPVHPTNLRETGRRGVSSVPLQGCWFFNPHARCVRDGPFVQASSLPLPGVLVGFPNIHSPSLFATRCTLLTTRLVSTLSLTEDSTSTNHSLTAKRHALQVQPYKPTEGHLSKDISTPNVISGSLFELCRTAKPLSLHPRHHRPVQLRHRTTTRPQQHACPTHCHKRQRDPFQSSSAAEKQNHTGGTRETWPADLIVLVPSRTNLSPAVPHQSAH